MSLKPTIDDFKEFIIKQQGLGLSLQGPHYGRHGVAIYVDSMSEAGVFLERLKTQAWFGLHLGANMVHKDKMGLGYILSWKQNKFETKNVEKLA